MKNVLIFAGIAGLAAAIAIYFVGEKNAIDDYYESGYVSDADYENYDLQEHTGIPQSV